MQSLAVELSMVLLFLGQQLPPDHFDLCNEATGVVCHQLGLLGTDLHAVGCGGFVKTLK